MHDFFKITFNLWGKGKKTNDSYNASQVNIKVSGHI